MTSERIKRVSEVLEVQELLETLEVQELSGNFRSMGITFRNLGMQVHPWKL